MDKTKNMNEDVNSEKKDYRKIGGIVGYLILIYSVIISLIHLWMNSFGLLSVIQKNIIHLSLMIGLVFLIKPANSKSSKMEPSLFDWICFILSIICGIYFFMAYPRLVESMMQPITTDFIYGLMISILLIEAGRRSVGIPLTSLALIFLLYNYVGPYMPGVLAHRGFGWERILVRMTMTSEGILGVAAMVSSSYVFMFILFASFLQATGASEFFNNISIALAGKARGGPAKIAIFASGVTGTINGSAQANVVTTGSFTIPLMKNIGYKPYFAGAVEAIASTGGQLMPPVMGAAAFMMSAILGVPYSKIILAALVPAILYYFTLYQMVDLRAGKEKLTGIAEEDIPNVKEVLLKKGHLVIPLFIIIIFLVLGFSPVLVGFIGIISVIIVSAIRTETRLSIKDIIFALYEGAQNAATIAIICGIVGYIIGSVGMTGLGQTIGNNIVNLAGGHLWSTAFLTMIVAIILGMGLPSAAVYLITATIASPGLIVLGIPPLAAHLFVFYFGIMSAVIPPVALTSFTAGAIAKADTTKIAFAGLLLGSAGLLLPYMFIYNPVILFIDFNWMNFAISVISLTIGLYFLSATIIGFLKGRLKSYERLILGILAGTLLIPVTFIRIFSLTFSIVIYFLINKRANRIKNDI